VGRDAGPPGFEGVKPGTHQVDDAVDGADEAVEAVAKLSVKGERPARRARSQPHRSQHSRNQPRASPFRPYQGSTAAST
jgi:hypothetical protein